MQYTISSTQNPRIERIARLQTKKYRTQYNQVVIEGERIVRDAINTKVSLDCIVIREDVLKKYNSIMSMVTCDILIVNSKVFDKLSTTQNSQGILAVINVESSAFVLPKTNFLVLDGIKDPGNLGTIIRTAVALDYRYIYVMDCVDYYNDKVLRATMGTIFKAIITDVSIQNIASLCQKFDVVQATMDGTPAEQIRLKSPKGIVLGSEARGVSKDVADLVKHSVSIPMHNDVESLNVATAGSILMYALKD